MECPKGGCNVSVLWSTSDKPCKRILNILEPCRISGWQTAKKRVAIIQMTTDQSICNHHWCIHRKKPPDTMKVPEADKAGFDNRIYVIGETKLCIKQNAHYCVITWYSIVWTPWYVYPSAWPCFKWLLTNIQMFDGPMNLKKTLSIACNAPTVWNAYIAWWDSCFLVSCLLQKQTSILSLSLNISTIVFYWFCTSLVLGFFIVQRFWNCYCDVHLNKCFSYDAPKLWNDLPLDIRTARTLSCFKRRLKTYLFQKPFPPYVL